MGNSDAEYFGLIHKNKRIAYFYVLTFFLDFIKLRL